MAVVSTPLYLAAAGCLPLKLPIRFPVCKADLDVEVDTPEALGGSPAAIILEPLRTSTSFLSDVTSTSTLSCTLHDSPLRVSVLFFFKENKQKVLEGKHIDEVFITCGLQSKNFMSLIMTA